MIDIYFEKLIIDFLSMNYPIIRIKHKGRFKRGIVFDDGATYIIFNENTKFIKEKLFEIIKNTFSCDDEITNSAIRKVFNF